MERDSFLYKARRKAQVAAHHIVPDDALSKIYYRIVLKKRLNLENPQTFNEKIQWMKLYYCPNNPLVVRCADKYAVRDYIRANGYGDKLVPLLGVWDKAENIDWTSLPQKFVLKCNHGCAYNILCENKDAFDKRRAVKQLNAWLKEDFGAFNVEIHYSKIKPRKIICEEYLGDCITDYKFFCFNGEPRFVYISNDPTHDRQAKIGFFNLDGTKIHLRRDDYGEISAANFPPFYNEMKKAASILSRDFPFVRVDFFLANHTYYFAELTFTPSAGMMPLNPDKFDSEWGEMLDISEIK